jgi:glycosyltransferase involved in cell wall biosynthesis
VGARVRRKAAGRTADVCLILEGTYPYVTGGVSGWVHQLVTALPDLTFALFHIAATRGETATPRYTLPPNVVDLVNVGLHGGDEEPAPPSHLSEDDWAEMRVFHDRLRDGGEPGLDALLARVSPAPGKGPSAHEMVYGRAAWEIVTQLYEDRAPGVSFVDYFWTWRFTHLPIFRLLHAPVPDARVYHTVSTGWAGLVAAMARARTGRPLLLTEHGIYSAERRIEIDQADWITVQRQAPLTLRAGPGFFKELWSRLFYRLARLTYAYADLIVTIYEGNRTAQIQDGADPARTLVVPNGVNLADFGEIVPSPRAPGAFTVGFVGRIVPIKDVKTFLRAFGLVAAALPEARARLVGPDDEDEEYAAECRTLVATLGIAERVSFTGRADVRQHYPDMDVIALTSLSEGLPLVMLEAYAAGLPVVASDVGACRELIVGRDAQDKALGPSGLVTGIADPGATADALLTLARDPGLRREMGEAGRVRVRRYYDEADLVRSYRGIYARLLDADARGPARATGTA